MAQPPDWKATIAEARKPRRLLKQLARLDSTGPYLDWNALSHLSPPGQLSAEEWWAVVKLRRSCAAQKFRLPGGTWSYLPTPTILQRIDRLMAGPEGVDSPSRDRDRISAATLEAIHSSRLDGIDVPLDHEAKHAIRSRQPARIPRLAAPQRVFRLLRRADAEAPEQPLTTALLDDLADQLTAGQPRTEPLPSWNAAEVSALNGFLQGPSSPEEYLPPLVRATAVYAWMRQALRDWAHGGRMARLLFHWSARRLGVEVVSTIVPSGIAARTPKKAKRALRQTMTDELDLNYVLLHHLETLERALDERDQRLSRKKILEANTPAPAGVNHRQRAILHAIEQRPETVLTIATHQEAQGIVYETARTDLADLARRGLLRREKRQRTFVYRPVVKRSG